MCIYLGDNPALTYDKQEHVFPAGLGGIQKLAHGIVSDQANELFSPMEYKLLHHSTLSVYRAMIGPGKRGKLDPKRTAKSQVCVAQNEDGSFELSYSSLSKPYTIMQAQFKGNTVSLLNQWNGEVTRKEFELIRNTLLNYNDRFKYIHSDLLERDTIIIGFLDGIYYVAGSGERPTMEYIQSMIERLKHPGDSIDFSHRESQVQQHFRLYENADTFRIYAKTCINVLAYLQGADYVRQSCFDIIRNWIISGGSDERFSYPRNAIHNHPAMQGIVPKLAHWCCVCSINSHLYAFVCFYNTYIREFDLGNISTPIDFSTNGFICDWQNRKEYTFLEYLTKECSLPYNLLSPD